MIDELKRFGRKQSWPKQGTVRNSNLEGCKERRKLEPLEMQ
jgi:hypothetical protein